jgi:hypothetical protein
MNHRSMVSSGLLRGRLDPLVRASWPVWAREHAQTCPTCQDLVEADTLLRRAGATLSAAMRPEAGPTPTLATLTALAAKRRRPAAADLVPPGARFRAGTYRSIPLEITRTSQGLRAWHPLARGLALYALPVRRPPVLLRAEVSQRPGIGFEVPYAPDRPTQVLAVATPGSLDPTLWTLWLCDWLADRTVESDAPPDPPGPESGMAGIGVPHDPENRVHFACLQVPASGRPLVERADPLPPAHSEVSALLHDGAHLGRMARLSASAGAYRQALELAVSLGDATGEAMALGGLAMVCLQNGFFDDADRILDALVERVPLDRTLGGWICRAGVAASLARDDIPMAEVWLARARACDPTASDRVLLQEVRLARLRGDLPSVECLGARIAGSSLPEQTRRYVLFARAEALAALGSIAQARAILGADHPEPSEPLELCLLRLLAEAAVLEAEGGSLDWNEALRRLIPPASADTGATIALAPGRALVEAAAQAEAAGHHEAAGALFRLRFLGSIDPPDPACPLLAAASFAGHTLVLGIDGHLVVHPLDRATIARLATRSREELEAGESPRALAELSDLLFPWGPPDTPFQVVSDGVLAEVPFLGLIGLRQGARLAPVQDLLGIPQSGWHPPTPCSHGVASLADSDGDLPFAGREVLRDEASTWLRGSRATRARLREVGPVGLLHVAVHTSRMHGIPELRLADGPLTAVEIAGMTFEGSPLVVLSGCATAAGAACLGIERSLADAFLRAGASAVVATRWPVLDREMYHLVRELVRVWPFTDVAGTVARVAGTLRDRGFPSRLWAAPVVYAPAWRPMPHPPSAGSLSP